MAVSDFWLEQAVDFVRKLRGQCDRCPNCGALACGQKHEVWHQQVEDKFETAQTAIQNLRNRVTATENEITSLKARVTALGG